MSDQPPTARRNPSGGSYTAVIFTIEQLVEADLRRSVDEERWATVRDGGSGRYVQWIVNDDQSLWLEAVSEHWRNGPEAVALRARAPEYRRLGWRDPDRRRGGNWWRALSPEAPWRSPSAAELLAHTLCEVYCADAEGLIINWGDRPRQPLLEVGTAG